jgi:DNA polymerase elongation subunit (family B)
MFPHLDGKPASELWDYCEYVAKEVSKLFPEPINLAYEEVIYKRFLILTKKRYMYLACDRNGVVSNKVGKKGVLLARRDNSQFIRTLYGDIIMKLFNKYDKDQLLYDLIQDMNKLCGAAYPSKDFVVTKAVGAIEDYKIKTLPDDPEKRQKRLDDLNCTEAEYATKCLPAQVQLAEKMRSRGMRVDAGSRLEYVITVGEGHKAKQSEKVEDIDYYRNYAESGILRLDYMYYLKLLSIPLDQVFRVVYGINDFVLNQYKYRLKLMKVHEELLNLFRPKIQMSEINFVIEE